MTLDGPAAGHPRKSRRRRATEPRSPKRRPRYYRETVYDAMIVALSGRIFLDETVESTPEQVLRQIWEDHFILSPAAAAPG